MGGGGGGGGQLILSVQLLTTGLSNLLVSKFPLNQLQTIINMT